MISRLIELNLDLKRKKSHFSRSVPQHIGSWPSREHWLSNLKEKIFSKEFYILINYQSGGQDKGIFRHARLGSHFTMHSTRKRVRIQKKLCVSKKERIQGNSKGRWHFCCTPKETDRMGGDYWASRKWKGFSQQKEWLNSMVLMTRWEKCISDKNQVRKSIQESII